jgi:hypothetical protein
VHLWSVGTHPRPARSGRAAGRQVIVSVAGVLALQQDAKRTVFPQGSAPRANDNCLSGPSVAW